MHVIIGGCGRVGAQLAERLAAANHDVVVVDRDATSFERIGDAFNGELVTGDITDKDALLRGGVDHADALAAVTQSDNANLMAVEIARELYGCRRTLARLFNPEREESYRKMGVHYVSGTRLVATAILNDLEAEAYPRHVASPDPDVEVLEMRVARDGHGVTIAEFEQSGDVRVASVFRGTRSRIPKLDDRLQADDVVVAAVRRGRTRHIDGWVRHPYVSEDR